VIGHFEAPTLEKHGTSGVDGKGALRRGRALVVCAGALSAVLLGVFGIWLPVSVANTAAANNGAADGMTVDEAAKLGEDFGIVVGEVDEEIQKELNLQRPQGVAVFEVIGNSRADYAGIKVRSVIKEIDKKEVKNMLDFGRHIKKAMNECNFTVGTYEPADPGDPVGWGVNFHFVGCKRD
jgi:membrane-associated protease RseP (regulator of RpoE activity)